jgi:hypothetical protein
LNKILESIGKFSSYILTSHERSCEQNGHGNTAARASIRFCFGGGFRLDFRLPIVVFLKKNLKKIKSTIVFIDKIKIDFFIFIEK